MKSGYNKASLDRRARNLSRTVGKPQSLSAHRKLRVEKKVEESVSDYYQSSPPSFRIMVDKDGKFIKLEEDNLSSTQQEKASSNLALPSLSPFKGKKRAFSAQSSLQHEDDFGQTEASSSSNINLDGDCKIEDIIAPEVVEKKQRIPFQVKILRERKEQDPDKDAKDKQAELELQAKIEAEEQERIATNKILMHHGVTASQSLQVSRRAAFQKKMSTQSIQDVGELIQSYNEEERNYRFRMNKLEQAEIQRLAKETAYKEELWNNHGKPKSYFKAPQFALASRVRSNSRRFKKMHDQVEEQRNELEIIKN